MRCGPASICLSRGRGPGRVWPLIALIVACLVQGRAQQIDAPAPGLLETGAPLFSVRSPESLGLSSPPTDLQLMRDGRLLVFAAQQFALGDGTRWEVFRQAADDPPVLAKTVAVTSTGEIYLAASTGFARIDLDAHGVWRANVVEPWQEPDTAAAPTLVKEIGSEWLWYSGSGALVTWQPGHPARIVGRADSVQEVFWFRDAPYLSDRTGGALWRLAEGAMQPIVLGERISAADTVTCTASFDPQRLLVGTYGRGLRIFDGSSSRPFVERGPLAGNIHINDLCATSGGYFAAAVDNVGIVFFDRAGWIVQVLDRRLDHRLAHVQRLVAAPGGVIWGRMNEGLVQVEFPSRVSHFESLIGSAMKVAEPIRHEGRLWLYADGSLRRAQYDDHGRLVELQVDTPADRFASNPSTQTGALIVATERGSYERTEAGWTPFAPEVNHLRVLDHPPMAGRWLYAAWGQIGWIGRGGGALEGESFAEPALEKVYRSATDEHGNLWLELGNGRVGRVRLENGRPTLHYFGAGEGVPDSWAQIFSIDGQVRFNIGNQILRFEESSRRFVPDREFALRFPALSNIVGRPGRDSLGRLWVTADGGVQVLAEEQGTWRNLREKMPAGFLPYYFTFQPDGVVWMHGDGRLARYDPSLPVTPEPPLRALITRAVIGAAQEGQNASDRLAEPLPFSENSLVVHFCAPGCGFRSVEFDVMLEGVSTRWIPSGNGGSAAFSDLREGRYLLRVRPRSGANLGTEATLGFEILPPWYRSGVAYAAYALGVIGVVLLSGRLLLFLQRRENARLESLVAERTRELHASNERLAAQLEENQILYKAVEQSPAAIYITDTDWRIIFANSRALQLTGRDKSSLLGLVLRGVRAESVTPELFQQMESTVSRGESWHGQIANRRPDGSMVPVDSVIAPIRLADANVKHYLVLEQDITEALNEQERRRRLEAQLIQAQKLESIGTLAGGIAHDFNNILTAILGYCELAALDVPDNPELQRQLSGIRAAGLRAKDLVSRILTFSRQNHVQRVPLDLAQPVAEAIKLLRASTPSTIDIVASLQSGTIRADATQIQQIVLNLCTNSIQAQANRHGRIEVTVQPVQVPPEIAVEIPELWVGPAMRLVVTDHGCGMDAATLRRIFDPFFTTKPQGEGTGLGLAIVQGVVAGHEGAIQVRSSPGAGTTVEIYFHPSDQVGTPPAPNSPVPRGQQQEIIVVDDERSVANFAATRLHQLGYRPMVFCDPQTALNAFAAQPTRFHAIVTDLTMPRLTGADLIMQIRSRGWLIPAVIITGYPTEAVRSNLQALPRCLVLPKPFSGDDLARALHEVSSDYVVRR